MAGYTRQSTYTDGDVIQAADSNTELDQVLAAFNNSTGHAHDGTTAEGPIIGLIGDAGVTTPLNKLSVSTADDRFSFYVDVAAASVEQLRIEDGVAYPVTNNDIDLGTAVFMFKDGYFAGLLESVNLQVTNIKANDGTASGSIADSTGIFTIASAVLTTADINGGTIDGTVIGGATPAAVTGTAITGTSFTTTGDMTFGDLDKAIFGAGGDLQISHDGNNSLIDEVGTGNLYLRSTNLYMQNIDSDPDEMMISAIANGAVTLSHNGSAKIATSASGVDVTGSVTAGDMFITGPSPTLTLTDNDAASEYTQIQNVSGDTYFDSRNGADHGAIVLRGRGAGLTREYARFIESGNFGIADTSPSERLSVTGNIAATGTVTADAGIVTKGTLSVDRTASGYGAVEIGGSSGGLIDLKAPFSDDYDARIIYNTGADLQIITLASGEPIRLKVGNTTRLTANNTGAAVTGNLIVTGTGDSLLTVSSTGTGDADATLRLDSADTGESVLEFMHDGVLGARIEWFTDGNPDLNIATQAGTDGVIDFQPNNSLAVRIDKDGNVGIGTAAPASQVHLAGGVNGTLRVDTTASGYLDLSMYSNGGFIATSAAQPLRFGVSNAEAMRINSSGNVGIGTTNPTEALTVSGVIKTIDGTDINMDAAASGQLMLDGNGYAGAIALNAQGMNIYTNSGSRDIIFGTNEIERVRIDGSGNVGIGTANPTEKLSVQAGDLGTTAGNSVDIFSLRSDTSNTDRMLYTAERISTGTDWTTAALRMQRKVDTTPMGYMQFGSIHSDLITFGENNTEYMRIDGSGRAIIPAGVTLGTAAGTYAAANTLDDYEEGVFTPLFSDGTHTDAVHNIQSGVYTKIGNRVEFNIIIRITSLGSLSGAVRVNGLPFAPTGNSAITVGYGTGLSVTAGTALTGYASTASYISLLAWDGTSGISSLVTSEVSSNLYLMVSGTYKTNA